MTCSGARGAAVIAAPPSVQHTQRCEAMMPVARCTFESPSVPICSFCDACSDACSDAWTHMQYWLVFTPEFQNACRFSTCVAVFIEIDRRAACTTAACTTSANHHDLHLWNLRPSQTSIQKQVCVAGTSAVVQGYSIRKECRRSGPTRHRVCQRASEVDLLSVALK